MVTRFGNGMRRTALALGLGISAALIGVAAQAQGLRLLMIEQTGCYICAAFNRDVAPAYEASPEGARAPLVHADLRGPLPEGVTLASQPFVTPTFILLDAEGHEAGRLIGYPGDDFFWPYINEMIDAASENPTG